MAEDPSEAPNLSGRNSAARNARTGLMLFFPYLIFYSGFVVLNTFAPQRMGEPVIAGLNLAVVYGFALIVGAFVLSIVYVWLCRSGAAYGAESGGKR